MALVQGGAFAERVVVHEATVMPKPAELSMVQAAAVPETWLTAFQLLFMVGNVKAGDAVIALPRGGAWSRHCVVLHLIALRHVPNVGDGSASSKNQLSMEPPIP